MIRFTVSKHVEKLFNEVVADVKKAGIPNNIAKVIKIGYNNSKSKRGECIKDNFYNEYEIMISKYLTDDWDIKSIIYHEILHTACWNHDYRFFYFIDKMHEYDNRYLRLYGSSGDKNCQSDSLNCQIDYKYTVRCRHCGKVYGYSRICGPVTKSNRYICGRCHTVGDFEVTKNY